MTDIGVTFKCNNNCIMCTEITPSKFSEPSTKDIIRTIDSLKNSDCIVLTGGEPTLRDNIFLIMKYINKKFPFTTIKLITNGRLFSYNEFVARMKKIKNLLVISELHGDEILHDKITRTKGSFRQTEEGIKNILKNDLDLELRIVIHKINYKAVQWIAKHISNFKKIKGVVIFPIDIIGNARKNREKLIVDYNTIMPYVEKGVEILKKNKIKVRLYHFPLCVLNPKYWGIAKEITVEEKRVTFMEECNTCICRNECSRVWKTYALLCGTKEFKAIKNPKPPAKLEDYSINEQERTIKKFLTEEKHVSIPFLQLLMDLRDVLRVEFDKKDVDKCIEMCNKYKLHFSTIEAKQIKRYEQGKPEREIFIYVSKSKSLAENALEIDKNSMSLEDEIPLARLFGYPECCIQEFINQCSKKFVCNPGKYAYKNCKKASFYLNNTLQNCPSLNNYSLIVHNPCSFSCEKSLSIARLIFGKIYRYNKEFAAEIEKHLRKKILYKDEKNIGFLKKDNQKIDEGYILINFE